MEQMLTTAPRTAAAIIEFQAPILGAGDDVGDAQLRRAAVFAPLGVTAAAGAAW